MRTCEYTFALLVDGFDVDNDDHVDALFARGCEDATPEDTGSVALITFYREGCHPKSVLWSAMQDVRSAVPSCRVVRVDDQLMNASDLARHIERSSESIRQLAAGGRGPGGFPAPAGTVGKGVKVWRWAEANPWLTANGFYDGETTLPPAVIAEANAHLLCGAAPADSILRFAGPAPGTGSYRFRGEVADATTNAARVLIAEDRADDSGRPDLRLIVSS